jgi:very-short-patch-repair endonuclease
MPKKIPSKHAILLNDALNVVGVETVIEYWDGHKHVDIYVPKANLCIEVDGEEHFTSPQQIITDIKRSEHSAEGGSHTFHVPNGIIEKEVMIC